MTITVAGNKKEYEDGLKLTELIEKEDIESPEYVTAQLQCFFNKWCEVFLLVNMDSSREGNHFCCKYSVSVAAFWRHQTVGSVEDRGWKMVKFFLLILPCSSEIAL